MFAREDFEVLLRRQHQLWVRSLVQIAVILVVIAISFVLVGLLDMQRITQGVPALINMVAQMLPPDFTRWQAWVPALMDTIAMSVAGTAMAIAISLPLSLLAARNTTPHPALFWFARLILNVARAIPELIMGIVLVAAVGFGTLPGVLALGLHSIGMVGKFFAESIEHIDKAPVEAARAVGASQPQIVLHSVLPQVLPQMLDLTFYRWEYNFRASMVLGAVGAGGIGFELIGALRILKYQEVSALMIVILGMVTLVDGLSNYLRQRFV